MNFHPPPAGYHFGASDLIERAIRDRYRQESVWMNQVLSAHVPPAISRNVTARTNLRFCALWLERNGFRIEWHPDRKEIWGRGKLLATLAPKKMASEFSGQGIALSFGGDAPSVGRFDLSQLLANGFFP